MIKREEWGKWKQIQGGLKTLTGKTVFSIVKNNNDDSDNDVGGGLDDRKEE